MGKLGDDVSVLVSYVVDQIASKTTFGQLSAGAHVQAQQQLLLEIVEEKLAESRRAVDVARDAIAGLIGLRVQLRRALGLQDSLAPARPYHEPLPVRRAAG
ncbi:MAG TPA: hypothetical protein VIA18_16205 [Polyangia bacterium]|nr:hypothetical protein [Polyangia bacterium]